MALKWIRRKNKGKIHDSKNKKSNQNFKHLKEEDQTLQLDLDPDYSRNISKETKKTSKA